MAALLSKLKLRRQQVEPRPRIAKAWVGSSMFDRPGLIGPWTELSWIDRLIKHGRLNPDFQNACSVKSSQSHKSILETRFSRQGKWLGIHSDKLTPTPNTGRGSKVAHVMISVMRRNSSKPMSLVEVAARPRVGQRYIPSLFLIYGASLAPRVFLKRVCKSQQNLIQPRGGSVKALVRPLRPL